MISLIFISLAKADSINFNAPTPLNDSTINGNAIPYNFSLLTQSVENISSIDVELYGSSGSFVQGTSSSGSLTAEGIFNSISDGTYYIYVTAQLVNGTQIESEQRFVKVNTPLSIGFEDPTQLNGTLVNMFSLPLSINVSVNKNPADYIAIYIYNSTGYLINVSSLASTNILSVIYALEDGEYSFFANASLSGSNVQTNARMIRISAVPPLVSGISSTTPIPDSTTPNTSLSLNINFSFISEFPSQVYLYAEINDSLRYRFNETYTLNNLSALPLNFNIAGIPIEGNYVLYLYAKDSDNNFAKYLIKNIEVKTPSPTPVPGGGGGGSYTPAVVNNTNLTSQNLTLSESNFTSNETSNETAFSPFGEPEPESKGIRSFITGAVTGLLRNPSYAAFIIIAAIIIIYAIVTIRNKLHDTKKSSKKNVKDSEKKE